jgi:hypothetical protein
LREGKILLLRGGDAVLKPIACPAMISPAIIIFALTVLLFGFGSKSPNE